MGELDPLAILKDHDSCLAKTLLEDLAGEAEPLNVGPDPRLQLVVDPGGSQIRVSLAIGQRNRPALTSDPVPGLNDGD